MTRPGVNGVWATVTASLLLGACSPPVDTTWHQENGYRWRALDVPRRGAAGFRPLDPSRTGITFTNTASDSLLLENRILAQGGGVCLGDVDGDGVTDVFLTRTEGPNALYRNQGGWRFENVTQSAGVGAPDRHSTGCALVDADGDGDLDLILAALGGPNALFLNDGSGNFTEQGLDAGPASGAAGSTTIAVTDVDGDGWLDLYIANYKAYTTLDQISPQERAFDQVVRQLGPRRFEVREQYRKDYKLVDREDLGGVSLVQRADPDFFYRNDGGGRFVREPMAGNRRFLDTDGRPLREELEDFGLAAMFADLDGDGAPDLYVANDFEDEDQFWRNDGRGGFRLVPWSTLRATSNSTMAVDVGDVNRDGWPDLFQVDMLSQDTRRLKTQIPTHTSLPKRPGPGEDRPQMQRNTLHLNRGDGTFAEVARMASLAASGWSWSTLFVDVDLDGWEDVLVGTGHRWDQMDGDTQYRLRNRLHEIDWRRMLFEFPPLPLPNAAFRNRGDLT
ncbi:MAG TPA: VCBS repeat-containing protein, partial [Gemmatimonadales bacterium]|nr:VCBS repeat-containing protein [Gemmatimonadales bacterium]